MTSKDPEKKKAYEAAYRKAHAEEIKVSKAAYRKAHAEEIKIKVAAYEAAHRLEKAAYNAVYYATHAEELRTISTAYRREHQAERKAAMAAWRLAHLDEVKAKQSAYRAAYPEISQAATSHRRARLANAPVNDFTAQQWREMQATYDHRCVYCKKRCKGKLTQDHITPITKEGSHTLANIVPACQPCNSRKYTGPVLTPVQPLLILGEPILRSDGSAIMLPKAGGVA